MDPALPRDPARRPQSGGAGPVILLLFSLPFCGVGIWMALSALSGLGQGQAPREAALRAAFALAFGGAGFGMLYFSRWLKERSAQERALRQLHPDEPWRWRPDWATGRVAATDGAAALALCFFAGLWNAMTIPLLLDLRAAPPFALLFPLVGLGLLVWAAHAVWRRRRFGRCTFEMETLPGVLGGALRGAIHVPAAPRPAGGFRLKLACIQRVVTGAGKSRSVREDERWSQERILPPTAALPGPRGAVLPVAFEIPYELPPASPAPSNDAIVWRLSAGAELPGVDFAANFEVPVFRTGASRAETPRAEATASGSAGAQRALGPAPAPLTPGSRITAARLPDGGTELYFPAGRSPSGAAALTVLALVWNGLLLFMGGPMPASASPFLALFTLVGLVLVLSVLDAWLGTVRMQVRPGRLVVTRRILGIGRTRVLGPDDLADLAIEANGHVGSKVFYALRARRAGRKRRSTLVSGFDERAQAERTREIVQRALAGDREAG